MKTKATTTIQQQVLFEQRFLEQYTGKVLLTDQVAALVELVANGWDAGATRVQVDWPCRLGDSLRVTDNGNGMSEEQLCRRWLTLSYDRIKEQGAIVEVQSHQGKTTRHVFGRNGIGRFAAFCFGKEYTVQSSLGGTGVVYAVRRGVSKPIELDRLSEVPDLHHGTTIEVKAIEQNPLSAETIRAELGKRFLTDPAFEVLVDSVRVNFEDIGERGVEKIQVPVPGLGIVHVLLIDAQRTDRTTKQHGVAWHVNGRLVGPCGWSGNGFDDLVDGRRIEAKRYTFIITADLLVGAVKPDWSGFHETDKRYESVRSEVLPKLRERLLCLSKERRNEATREVRRANAEKLKEMTPLSREKWNDFVEKAQETCPSLSQPELQNLSGILANLEVSRSQYGLLSKLHKLDSNQLDSLDQILADWSVDTAKIVLDELKGRLKVVDELRHKTASKETLEVQELQPLFQRALWIFGPEFETIHFTSNEGMTSVIQTLFGKDIQGSRCRPDFAILPNSSVGFYGYPKYDDYGSEIYIDRLVIVELKKPGVPIGDEQKGQCWRYVKELYEKGLLSEGSRVDCYVLGSEIDQNEREPRTEKSNKVRIIPLDFNITMDRAKSRLLKLYDRVRSAPFLQDKNIDAFLDDKVDPADELHLSAEEV